MINGENLFTFPAFDEKGTSDIPKKTSKLKGKLVVESIVELNRLLDSNEDLVDQLRASFGSKSGLDLVSSGHPCQIFSIAGLRKLDCDRNTLP
jgi:DNA (cytosine-5)-methyltransferase 1